MPAMKRKLNEDDVPEASEPTATETTAADPAAAEPAADFASLGLEPRLLRGCRDQVDSSILYNHLENY